MRGRLAAADQPAAMVVATKPTSALPVVGGVSAVILIVIGYLLGGWVVAAGDGGVRPVHLRRRPGRHPDHQGPARPPTSAKGLAPTMEPTEPAPTVVTDAIARIEGLLA